MDTKTQKISIGTKFAYAAGEMGSQLSFYMISTYLTLFYTDAVKLGPAIVSILMLLVRIIDAISAPVLGNLIDHTDSKFGKCRPWIIRSLPFLLIFSVLTFSNFNMGSGLNIVYAGLTYIALALAYSMMTGALQTMVNTLTPDSQERAVLNSWKNASGSLTGILLAGITMPLIIFFGSDTTAYFYTNMIYAVISIPLFILTFLFCKETPTLSSGGGPKASMKESLVLASHNSQLLSIMVYNIFTLTATFSRLGVMAFYYIYTIGRPELVGVILMGFQIGQLIPPFIVPFMVKNLGKKRTFFIANVGQASSLIILYFLGQSNILIVFAATFLLGFFMMNGLTTFNATSDCIEYEFYKTGKLSPGLIVGAVTLAVKIGLAIGGSLGIFLIGFTGYHSGVDVTNTMKNGISLVANIFPAVLFILGLVALIPYKLTNKRVAEIQAANMKKMEEISHV